METSLSDYARLSELIATQIGLYFPQARQDDLKRGMVEVAKAFNFTDTDACVRWLLSTPMTAHINVVLAQHLSIGETYFFRDKPSLKILEEQVLPPLLAARRDSGRRLRIWSAACSTGEEAYTLAILLDKLLPDIKTWHITLLGTDFNPTFLRKAAQGLYREWSFRAAPAWLKTEYFIPKEPGVFELAPHIRKRVSFAYLNFVDDVYPSPSNSAMDIIFCRNVLMYFSPQQAKQVADKLHHALIDGGWLITSPAETSSSLFSAFTPVHFPEGVLYRKLSNTQPSEHSPAAIETSYSPDKQQTNVPLNDIATIEPPPSVNVEKPIAQRDLSSQRARSLANQGKYDEALACCALTIATDKINPTHYYLQANILQEQGLHDEAKKSLMRALYLDQNFALAHFALGNLHQLQKNYPQAKYCFCSVLLLLHQYESDEIVPEADGLTVERLIEIVTVTLKSLPP